VHPLRDTELPAELQPWCSKIWGSHGGDYEKCHLLGYKHPLLTWQETLRLRYRVQPVNAM
jgi:hypothetical protein